MNKFFWPEVNLKFGSRKEKKSRHRTNKKFGLLEAIIESIYGKHKRDEEIIEYLYHNMNEAQTFIHTIYIDE